jgi:hypothetical protein
MHIKLFGTSFLFGVGALSVALPDTDLEIEQRDVNATLIKRRNPKWRGWHHIDCNGIENSCNEYCASFYCFGGNKEWPTLVATDQPGEDKFKYLQRSRWPLIQYEADNEKRDRNRNYSGCNGLKCQKGESCDEWPIAMHVQEEQFEPFRNTIQCLDLNENRGEYHTLLFADQS